jgi:hypothetical protein
MALSSRWVRPDKSVPLGRYSRSIPLVLSLLPSCHGFYGSAKKIRMMSR